MTEACKVISGQAPPIMDNFFIFRERTHNLINFIKSKQTKVGHGSETISYRTSFLWANSPRGIQTRKFLKWI